MMYAIYHNNPLNLYAFAKVAMGGGLTIISLLFWTTLAHANNPGDLDTTFNETGVVTTSITEFDQAFGVAIQPDDKLVVTGLTSGGGNQTFATIRYNKDGSLDTTFNNTGIVTTSITGDDGSITLATQDDGKVVVGGVARGNEGGLNTVALVRYTITGTLDTSFNNTGSITTPVGSQGSSVRDIKIQADGKIIGGGSSSNEASGSDFTLVRYTSTGMLDTTFNNTGVVTTSIPEGRVMVIALQPDGKIIAGGSTTGGAALARYTSEGSLDTTFNQTGVVTTNVGNIALYGVALQADGKILVSGAAGTGSTEFALMRFTPDGALDTTFNGTGLVTTSINITYVGASGVAVQPNGRIVVTGGSDSGNGDGNFAILRYNSDGALDTTFGGTGIITTVITTQNDGAATSPLIQSDGKIVAVGSSTLDTGSAFTVVRYIGDPYLTLTKTANNATPQTGERITYTLAIHNPSLITATNTLISDALPLSLTLAGAITLDPPQANAILATSALSLPAVARNITIAANNTITVTYPVTVEVDTSTDYVLTNSASVSSSDIPLPALDTAVLSQTMVMSPTHIPIILKNE
ncbi:MAG: hypothetical protein AAF485_07380 [Chloroflexota bacterium]